MPTHLTKIGNVFVFLFAGHGKDKHLLIGLLN